MVCESMAEDLSEGSMSNNIKSDQFTSADDYAPKVRKPYTITKQRERWTEEEHKKFLEALRLYGRAWRRIEEHVGTKTAVQIRSHAQKFFSKVVRESTSGEVNEVKPIEIPPPRPKRKPMHPYPRKLSTPLKAVGHHARSTSPNSSTSDQENQSPTSVLSAGGSNIFALADSGSPNTGSSPDSSANDAKPDGSSSFEPELSPDQENASSPTTKLESFGEEKEREFVKESSPDAGSTLSLKLFGKTVVVTDNHQQSSPNFVQQNMMPISSLPCGAPVYYLQFLDENSGSSTSMSPWWGPYGGGVSYPLVQPAIPTKESGSEMLYEGSLTGSNTSDSESGGPKEERKTVLVMGSERSAFTKQHRGNNVKKDKCIKGFVPYKRCLAQMDTQLNGEEREEQRVRLRL